MSELVKLQILTADSVDRLRVIASGDDPAPLWTEDLDTLAAEFQLKFVHSSYDINPEQGLQLSSPGVAFRELDAINAERMLTALPNLTPADATDERLWVTLALGAYRGYMLDRWPKDSSQLGKHLLNHVFASTGRARERDHAVARLWWSGYYVSMFAPTMVGATLSAFFSNSDLSVQLLGRPNLATVPPIARGVLSVFRKYFHDQTPAVPYSRDGVRSLLEGLDYLAGRRAIGVLSDSDVETLLETSFIEHLGIEEKRGTVHALTR